MLTQQELTTMYAHILDGAIKSLEREGRHNQASILKDVKEHMLDLSLQLTHYEIGAEMEIEKERAEDLRIRELPE